MLDKRKRKNVVGFKSYLKPLEIEAVVGANGPDHSHDGQTLGEIEDLLRADIHSVIRSTVLSSDERRHYRARIQNYVETLNAQGYSWPGGRPMAPPEAPPRH